MIALVLRRARVQRGLLLAVVVLVATACTLVGTCTLLLDRTQELGFARAVQQVPPDDVAVTAFLLDLTAADATTAADEAADVVGGVLASLRPSLETTTTSRLRDLSSRGTEAGSQGYLVATDGLAERAELTSGRWPAPTAGRLPEAVVPTRTAALLGLAVGDEVALGRETGIGGVDGTVRMRLVGTFDPRSGIEWERDPLGGTGFSPTYSDGLEPAPTYGPFVVDAGALAATGSTVNAVRVTARPELGTGSTPALRVAVDRLATAPELLDARVGDRADLTRVGSELPRTLDRLDAQQVSTRSTVLVVLLLGLALSLAAALMTGRLVGSVRQDERDLLASWGLDRRQQLGAAATEAALVAAAGALVAVPVAALVHARLTGLDDLVAAGLEQRPAVTPALLLSVVGTAVVLAAGLVAASWQAATTADPAPVRRVRLALDAVLALVAGASWWQLRGRAASYDGGVDVVLALAPVVCLVALTVLGTRLVAPALARAARPAVRSRALVVPLALQQAARRVPPATATLLLAVFAVVNIACMVLRRDPTP
ncbi:FtsX-like permease family protein, partial [Nocardioides zeicaulis]